MEQSFWRWIGHSSTTHFSACAGVALRMWGSADQHAIQFPCRTSDVYLAASCCLINSQLCLFPLCTCRMGQVLLVDAPWFFKGPWEAIKPLLRKYAALVRFVSRQELANEFFTSQTLPKDFAS
eukprot:GHRR01029988.1.p1 GENE.GHRR01029988.1~~GHRR01029988.1.p1  ORF type:complete len:123 (-),score=6.06 GHRR01029988.1:492-860(-)